MSKHGFHVFGLLALVTGCATSPAAPPPAALRPGSDTAPSSPPHNVATLAGHAAGPGGGWIIGAASQSVDPTQLAAADRANRHAEQQPAALADARRSDTADLNHDGFVTLDEVVALKRAALTDDQIIDRIRRTGDVFHLTDRQEEYLRGRGIDQRVIDAMKRMDGSPRAGTATLPAGAAAH